MHVKVASKRERDDIAAAASASAAAEAGHWKYSGHPSNDVMRECGDGR